MSFSPDLAYKTIVLPEEVCESPMVPSTAQESALDSTQETSVMGVNMSLKETNLAEFVVINIGKVLFRLQTLEHKYEIVFDVKCHHEEMTATVFNP